VGYIGTMLTDKLNERELEKSTKGGHWCHSWFNVRDWYGRIYNYHARTDDLLAPGRNVLEKNCKYCLEEAANICLATIQEA
jgi:hypothetical protein